jgi:carboxypeptidase family protein
MGVFQYHKLQVTCAVVILKEVRVSTFEKNWKWRVVLAALFALMLSSAAHAQTATLTGTVTDPTGAAAPDVVVTITNEQTGIVHTGHTSDTGGFNVGELQPSFYVVAFEKTGFRKLEFTHVQLTVDQTLTLNAKLEVSAVAQTVEVSGQVLAPVELQNAAISNVIQQEQITELPLILRDPYQLVLLGPGVTQSDNLGGVSVNGGRERNNNFMLDGADNNDADVPGGLGGITSQNPDSTQEFRVITNNFAPEYGRNNGAIIDVITRSGTNDYHGDAYYYGRWDALGANDFFANAAGLSREPYVRNLYGVSAGGPIVKNHSFFFLNYQGDRFITTVTNESTVPTEAFKTGIFTYTNPATGVSQALNVTTPGVANNATGVGIDPVMARILALYPAPTVDNGDGVTGTLFFPSSDREKDESGTFKFDQTLGSHNNFTARYIYNWFSDPNESHDDFLPGGLGGINSHARTQSLALGLTTTAFSNFVNELRFAANRTNQFFGCNGVSLFDSLGFTDPEGRGADFTLPFYNGFGCQVLGDSDGQERFTGTYQTIDNMTKVKGPHTFRWGVEFRDEYSNNYDDFSSRGAFTFNIFTESGIPTLMNMNPAVDTNQVEDLTSALLGLVNQQAQTQYFNSVGTRTSSDLLGFRQREWGLFVQDTYKVRSNLTLTYGLRWEYYGVPFESHNNLSTLFQDPSGPAPFNFSVVGPGTGQQLYKDYYKDYEPRVGFAWDPFKTGKTSVRGGLGIFSDRIYGNLVGDVRGNPPFQPSYAGQVAEFFGPTAGAQLQNQTAPPMLSASPTVDNFAFAFPDIFDQNLKPPRIVTWNFGIQREIASGLTVEANYVGNKGTHIIRVLDGNAPQPALVSQLEQYCSVPNVYGCDQSTLQFATLYFGGDVGELPFDATNNNAFYHTFTDQTSGRSSYNGLQMQITERAFHGLLMQFSYTYSHALDDSSDPLVQTIGNGNYPIDSFHLGREYGNSGFDTRHRGVLNFVYKLPFGRGTSHLTQGALGHVFEGWELSGIGEFQTGLPYDIFQPYDTLHTGLADRATVIGSLHNPSGTDKAHTGPPLSAFATVPDFGVPSNVGRNFFYGPGIDNWDLSLAKTTTLTERFKFQIRLESYNIFNHVHFAKPDNELSDSTFGLSLSQVGQNDGTTGARQVQIGAKLIF